MNSLFYILCVDIIKLYLKVYLNKKKFIAMFKKLLRSATRIRNIKMEIFIIYKKL